MQSVDQPEQGAFAPLESSLFSSPAAAQPIMPRLSILDLADNRTKEETKDSGGSLRCTVERIYDQLGRLQNVRVQ